MESPGYSGRSPSGAAGSGLQGADLVVLPRHPAGILKSSQADSSPGGAGKRTRRGLTAPTPRPGDGISWATPEEAPPGLPATGYEARTSSYSRGIRRDA